MGDTKKHERKENKNEYASCIIQNKEIKDEILKALSEYFKSLPEERLLEIESYMTLD